MDQKNELLEQVRKRTNETCANIEREINVSIALLKKRKDNFNSLSAEQKIVENKAIPQLERRIEELENLKLSPYFSMLDFDFQSDKKNYKLYIGKFSNGKENIYSWTTPVAALRFEEPGQAKYLCPGNVLQKVNLKRKDQMMIVDKKLRFLATETIGKPRELIFQEHFSNRKSGFMLPEIIAEMEKAQDQVIRAHHVGPFLISGPAGSGKTTLALHRVAYLLQSPDLCEAYESDSTIVFVQDNGTKEYFSHLLPELGIDNVLITTFSEWALSVLQIPKIKFSQRIGCNDIEKDEYEFAKISSLRTSNKYTYFNNPFSILRSVYGDNFTNTQKNLFENQIKSNTIDKIDLIILLQVHKDKKGFLGIMGDHWVKLKNGTFKKKHELIPYQYNLAVIDEFQNYLPEQLRLIKSCIDKKTRSIVYVGDMAQQVNLGTLKEWSEIGEEIDLDRKVTLQKVYRNTKNILQYINTLGFQTEIPESLKEGQSVVVTNVNNESDIIKHIKNSLVEKEYMSVGILVKDEYSSQKIGREFLNDSKIHAMTMNEAQGVEFDIVFLLIPNPVSKNEYSCKELEDEKTKISRDLLYVALTRAISELHVINTK